MNAEVLKAINDLSKRLNAVERKVENFLLSKHDESTEAISVNEGAILELADAISELLPEDSSEEA